MNDADRAAVEARQDKTLLRLHSLIARGYVAELGKPDHGAVIWLSSPVPSSPSLTLYSDGMVATTLAKINDREPDDPSRILNATSRDDAIFSAFVNRLKKPTWRQRTAEMRAQYVWVPMILIAFYGACFAIVPAFQWLWKTLTS